MLILADHRIPAEAKERLSGCGTLMELQTEGIVYPAISGHPDIFFCQTAASLVVSPSLPQSYMSRLKRRGLEFVTGSRVTGSLYPSTVHFNAAVNDRYLVHRLEHTDPRILEKCHTLRKIAVMQGYTRCNLILLRDHHYITSDAGIHRALAPHGLNGIFVSPEGIHLPGFPNGFIGGVAGLFRNTVFFNGRLSQFAGGRSIRMFLDDLGYEIIELYDGPLIDAGGILFLREPKDPPAA